MKTLPESGKYQVMKVMEKIDKWNYDVWIVQDFTTKGVCNVLYYVATRSMIHGTCTWLGAHRFSNIF